MRPAGDLIRAVTLIAGLSVLAGCIGPPKCDTEARYQSSRGGERIEAPDDLDELQSYKELTIPRSSPREQQVEDGRCLEMPPPISSGRSE